MDPFKVCDSYKLLLVISQNGIHRDTVGTPAQTFTVFYDTGSTDIIVPGESRNMLFHRRVDV